MFKIGNVVINGYSVLGPMAGVSNSVYRQVAKEHGACLVYSEMISEKGILYKNKKTLEMLYIDKKEHPIALQIFGSDIESFTKAAIFCDQNTDCDIIDINMGCPVNKVAISSQAGSALLKDCNKVYEIIKSVVDNVKKPVTIKIRSGWDDNHINCVEIAKAAQKAGASAIAIHARTRQQLYKGKSDWSLIKKVKQAVTIPVIGNGDVIDASSALKMLQETGVDGIMVARASQGNPWIFNEIEELLQNNNIVAPPSNTEIIKVLLDYVDRLIKLKNEHIAMLEMRQQLMFYFKRLNLPKEARIKAVQINSYQDILDILKTYNLISQKLTSKIK